VSGVWEKRDIDSFLASQDGIFVFLLGEQDPVSVQNGVEVTSYGAAAYAYDYFRITENIELVGGINVSYQKVPVNVTTSPISAEREDQHQVNPKAALIWTPCDSQTFRISYARYLGALWPADTLRLEPSQVAGLSQNFREVVPSALVGELSGADVHVAETDWSGRFADTFLGIGAEFLSASRDRRVGLVLSSFDYQSPPTMGLLDETVRFNEESVRFSLHQLVADGWSLGFQYRFSYDDLKQRLPEYQGLGYAGIQDNGDSRGWLHTISLNALYRDSTGLFARADANLFIQAREQQGASLAGDEFWQVNGMAGYRFAKQRAEIAVGVLNLFDQDYRLDPISVTTSLPRSRTFYARLLLDF
jgi:hypothetical protein